MYRSNQYFNNSDNSMVNAESLFDIKENVDAYGADSETLLSHLTHTIVFY